MTPACPVCSPGAPSLQGPPLGTGDFVCVVIHSRCLHHERVLELMLALASPVSCGRSSTALPNSASGATSALPRLPALHRTVGSKACLSLCLLGFCRPHSLCRLNGPSVSNPCLRRSRSSHSTTHSLALGPLHPFYCMESRLVSQAWAHLGFQSVPHGHRGRAIKSLALCLIPS